ncbi:outer membrane beta-barrel family protein [uncultured Chryseobacterium sp.]|uniref:outer membrane beta-barrel family protein n=1 Tax=uncultured Chryseobacterium sp. TaxID=259322 RepID=UPI0025F82A65|nr:outer membrane beta-barrel family protein [uncultured Chryseobacterium sp.]
MKTKLRKILLFILFICYGIPLFAQNLSGVVTNDSRIGMKDLEIIATKENQQKYSSITNEKGEYNMKGLTPGNYLIEIFQNTNKVFSENLTVSSDITKNYRIEAIKNIEGIVIQHQRKLIERKVDRLILNIENSIAASGGDALDAIGKVPGVRVANENISITGKSNLMIMIDNRLVQLTGNDLTEYLKTIKSDDIKSVELITNPPAKYSAEGNSGLINIVMKKQKKDTWNTSLRSVYHQATYPTGGLGGTLNYNKNNLSLLANLGYTKGKTAPVETNSIFYPTERWNTANKRKDLSDRFNTKLDLEYKSKKITNGLKYNGIFSNPEILDNSVTDIDNGELTTLNTKGSADIKDRLHTFNYHFIYNIDEKGRILSADFDLLNLNDKTNRRFTTVSEGNTLQNSLAKGNQKVSNYSVNIDMEHPLKEDGINLNYGARFSFITTKNRYNHFDIADDILTENTGLTDYFILKENTQALYASASKKFTVPVEAKFGLRIENTQLEGNSVLRNIITTNNYIKFFPTFYIVYSPDEKNTYSFNYGKRINRPAFDALNPFRWILSPFTYSEGNPILKPSISDNFELSHTYKSILISTLFINFLKDGFNQFSLIDQETKVSQIKYLNFINSYDLGLSEILNINISKNIITNISGTVFYSHSKSYIPETPNQLNGWNANLNISNDVTLNQAKTLSLNITYNISSKGVDNINYVSGINQLDATLKYLMLKKKLTASFQLNDILSSNRPEYTTYSNGLKNTFKNYYDNRFFRLAITYNFGGKLEGTVKERETKNQEEIDRITK